MNIRYLEFSFSVGNIQIDARIDYFNALKNIKPESYAMHSHTMYEVYFIESGTLLMQCGQGEIELKEHDIFVLFPNTEHRIISCSEDFKRFNFRFLFGKKLDIEYEGTYFFYRPEKDIEDNIYQNIASIHLYFHDAGGRLNSFRIRNSFGILLSFVVEQILPPAFFENFFVMERSDSLTQRILIDRFFRDNHSKHVTIENLAASMNYSKTQVNRLLLKYTNKSFAENLSLARLDAAQKYLKETKLSISDIAYKCGFSSLRGFELFIQKHLNMLPAEYRKKNG